MFNDMLKGIALSVFAAMLFGGVTMSAKSLLSGAGPATIGMLTYLGAGLVGLLAAICSRTRPPPARADARTGTCFFAALVIGAIVAPLLLMQGLQRTTASFGAVLANIEGIATVLVAWFLFREKANAFGILSVITVLAGVLCFTGTEDLEVNGGAGPALVGLAYVCWAIDLNLMRHAQRFAPETATAIRGISGAAVMGGVAWFSGEALPSGALIASALIAGAIGFGLSFILMLKALPSVGSAKAGAIFASAPVFGYLYTLAGTNTLDAAKLMAILLIVLGILIAATEAFAGNGKLGTDTENGRETGFGKAV